MAADTGGTSDGTKLPTAFLVKTAPLTTVSNTQTLTVNSSSVDNRVPFQVDPYSVVPSFTTGGTSKRRYGIGFGSADIRVVQTDRLKAQPNVFLRGSNTLNRRHTNTGGLGTFIPGQQNDTGAYGFYRDVMDGACTLGFDLSAASTFGTQAPYQKPHFGDRYTFSLPIEVDPNGVFEYHDADTSGLDGNSMWYGTAAGAIIENNTGSSVIVTVSVYRELYIPVEAAYLMTKPESAISEVPYPIPPSVTHGGAMAALDQGVDSSFHHAVQHAAYHKSGQPQQGDEDFTSHMRTMMANAKEEYEWQRDYEGEDATQAKSWFDSVNDYISTATSAYSTGHNTAKALMAAYNHVKDTNAWQRLMGGGGEYGDDTPAKFVDKFVRNNKFIT